jgi:CHAP domain
MISTAAHVLQEAAKEIGYDEQGNNRTKFAAEAGHANGQAWCATYIAAILKRCNVPVPARILVPSSRTMYAEAKAKGWAVTLDALKPGDVIHTWRGLTLSKWIGHVAFVEQTNRDAKGRVTSIITIEGNTNNAGSPTGGEVLRKTRTRAFWRLGAWRPPYAP